MRKKYFIYLLLTMFMGCKTGGPQADLYPEPNQSMVGAFSKMIADKKFSSDGGTTFSENGDKKFTFTDPSGLTFSSTTLCNPVKSEVKADGVVMNFEPAVCRLLNVGYYYGGSYVEYGKYYFITTQNKDGHIISFAFKGRQPGNGVYHIDNHSIFGELDTITPAYNEYAYPIGDVTVNTENGFHLSATNLLTGASGYSVISLSIGCCGR